MNHDDGYYLSRVGQTETIVEGHTKYSWLAEKYGELEQSASADGWG